jgi:3-phosphoshikimate 1-carboxyvinyltransferase
MDITLDLRDGACGSVQLPGSKSFSIRALLLAACARGTTELHGLLRSDDTEVMIQALRQLGVHLEPSGAVWSVQGCSGAPDRLGSPEQPVQCFVGNSGLTIRTLLPAVVAFLSIAKSTRGQEGCVEFSGVPRMHERPIGDLVDGLRHLGAQIDYLGVEGFPPLRVRAAALVPSESWRVKGSTSSQFLTGLLQAAPGLAQQWQRSIEIRVQGPLISRPYVDLSLAMLRRFGAQIHEPTPNCFRVEPGQGLISPDALSVEGDASSASYFMAAGVLGGGPIRVEGAGRESLQGDVQFAHALVAMGAQVRWEANAIEVQAPIGGLSQLRGVDLDCNHIPDAAMTLVPLALYAQGSTRLHNIGSWRVKETDRIEAMAAEARKLGAHVETGPDFIVVHPPLVLRSASIHTYDDHRVAMSFSLVSFRHPGDRLEAVPKRTVTILDAVCVAKTFPDYFEVFADVCARAVPVIAIDGPTASGKGTVAARVARALGFAYLDSGALYRLVALAGLRAGLDPSDESGLTAIASNMQVRFDSGQVWMAGEDVTLAIRDEQISVRSSQAAALPGVRAALLRLQRDFARLPGLVCDGRDMASVVFPQAMTKIFLTADAQARARRRYEQLRARGEPADLQTITDDLRARDARDSQRSVAPLKYTPNAGVHYLDTTEQAVEESVTSVLAWANTDLSR